MKLRELSIILWSFALGSTAKSKELTEGLDCTFKSSVTTGYKTGAPGLSRVVPLDYRPRRHRWTH